MFLSSLEIDTGASGGRSWLANPYRVHQRLSMAFPEGFDNARVLFRIEADHERARIIVQSCIPPDWESAFRRFSLLLSRPEQKQVDLSFRCGQRLRFLLRANPTVRRSQTNGTDGAEERRPGKRHGLVREEDQRAWLARKGDQGGFRPLLFEVRPRGLVSFGRGKAEEGSRQTHVSVEFEGHLEVTDPVAFAGTVHSGIGAAKAFGFGLLSIAPQRG